MVTVLYSVVAIVSFCIVLMTVNMTQKKDEYRRFDEGIRFVYCVTALFLLCDAIWGLCACQVLKVNMVLFEGITMCFYGISTYIASVWYWYTIKCLKLDSYKRFRRISMLPAIAGFLLVFVNPFTHVLFSVGTDYSCIPGRLRFLIYCIQMIYFIGCFAALFVYRLIYKAAYHNTITIVQYSVVLVIAAIVQYAYDDAPVYSLGFMCASVLALVGNVFLQEEKRLIKEREEYRDSSEEVFSALEALGESFIALHIIDFENESVTPIRSNKYIEKYRDEDNLGERIKKTALSIANVSYAQRILEFLNFDTLAVRMQDKRMISFEFLSAQFGWCILSCLRVVSNENDEPVRVILGLQSIDDSKLKEKEINEKLQKALENKNTIYAEMLQAQPTGVVATSLDSKIIIINKTAANIFGYDSEADVPSSVYELMTQAKIDDRPDNAEKFRALKERGIPFSYYFSITNKDGKERYILADTKRITLMDGEKIVITSFSDISKNKEIEKELKVMSDTDKLSGLNNRGSGERKITKRLSSGEIGVFLIFDIDKFKSINDTFGHAVGDFAISEIAKALTSSFRESDVIMRLGGDEFVVFAGGLSSEKVLDFCLRELFVKVSNIKSEECPLLGLSLSVGAAFAHENDDVSFEELYRRADSVMYESKSIEGNSYKVYIKDQR